MTIVETTSIGPALDTFTAGQPVLLVDDDRPDRGADLLLAAEFATAERLAFLIRHGSGLVCCATDGGRLDALDLAPMVTTGSGRLDTAFAVSVDYRHGTTTGISAGDRATTLQALADPATRPSDLLRPGHIFPLRAAAGGVLERKGSTEAAVDLARLATVSPVVALTQLVGPDGELLTADPARRFAADHGLAVTTLSDVVGERLRTECLVTRLGDIPVSTRYGEFTAYAFRSGTDGTEHVAFVGGDPDGGLIVYLGRTASGIGQWDALRPSDYHIGAQILASLESEAQR